MLQLHKDLTKAESSLLTQLCTGCIRLKHFLTKHRVPGFLSSQCECQQGAETPWHVIMSCELKAVQQSQLKSNSERLDFVQLLTTPKGAKVVTRWMMESHRLPQFNLALSLSYEGVP